MYIQPIKGKLVIDPDTQEFLSATGKNVDEHDIYWQRRINDGDVEIVDSESVAEVAATTKSDK